MRISRLILTSASLLFVWFPGRAHAQNGVTAKPSSIATTAADSAAIRATVLDYVEGWYAGDAERMERAVHPELAKRIVITDRTSGRSSLDHMGAMRLVQGTRRGGGKSTPEAEREREVRILDVFNNAASARATMSGWVDYLHLAKYNGRWVIVNVLWEYKTPPEGSR